MDLVTPPVQIPAGKAIGGANYEPDVKGYRRIGGYERFDGRPKPSQASYWVLAFDAGTAAIAAGEVVVGAASSAAGIALVDAVVTSGSYGGSDAAGYLVLYGVLGTFQDDEALQVSSVTRMLASGTAEEEGADTDDNDTTWKRAAVAATRLPIAAVPGSGAVRGIVTFGGDVFAFRDNTGATAGKAFEATASGWSEVTFGSVLKYDAGTAAFNEGSTLTGATSGATATIRRVARTGGLYGSSNAVGYLVLASISGTFQNNEALSDNGAVPGAATADGTVAAVVLPAGGHYEFTKHNFYGASNLGRLYGCNGVGRAFEFDGTTLVPIQTGLDDTKDKPRHIAEYQNHLMLSVAGGSIVYSSTGEPLNFEVTTGAGEIGFGQDVTGLQEAASSALVIGGADRVSILTGSSNQDFLLSPLADDTGIIEWSLQYISAPIYLDQGGVRKMNTTQAFGGFRVGTLTQTIEPLIRAKLDAGVYPVASIRVRSRDQYRLFFSDKTGLTIYLGRKNAEVMPFALPIQVSCAYCGEDANGREMLLVGAEDGYVYQLDAGTSFDGQEIEAWIRFAFNSIGSPQQKKRWHKATLMLDGDVNTQISITSEVSYANPYQPSGVEQAFSVEGGGGLWNEANWNEFIWSTQYHGEAEAYLEGIGENISIVLMSDSTHEEPHSLSTLTLHFSYRGMRR